MKEFLKSKKGNIVISCFILLVAVVITVIVAISYKKFSNYQTYFYFQEGKYSYSYDDGGTLREVEGEKSVQKFSQYSPKLKNTVGDADIYVIDSKREGPSLLVLGGTHPNEPSGQVAATVLLENAVVTRGKLFIITEANKSAYTHSHPQEASPYYYSIKTKNGVERIFKFGSRATNTNEQWPVPDIYVHSSGQKLTANDTKNLNRAYPGSENGTYTERVAYAITNLIKENDITVTIDLHEASPEYNNINSVTAHQRALALAANASLNMELYMDIANDIDGVAISVNESPFTLHGLTHRELGDYTNTLALLCETSNASQGKLRGKFTSDLIVNGQHDKFYQKALELQERENNDKIVYAAPTTLDERVARHVLTIESIIKGYNAIYTTLDNAYQSYYETHEAKIDESMKLEADHYAKLGKFEISNIPSYSDLNNVDADGNSLNKGVGYFLHDPLN